MSEVRLMPYDEKLASIMSFYNLVEDFASRIVKKELGVQKEEELRTIWKTENESIPNDASDKEKYELVYRNFVRNWVTAEKFMVKNLGEAGSRSYMKAAIDAWKRKYSSEAMQLKILGRVSRKRAFRTLAQRLAYDLQVFSPFTVTELEDDHLTLSITPCKIAESKGGADFCLMACRNVVPSWLEAQFNVNMTSNPQEKNCEMKFTSF